MNKEEALREVNNLICEELGEQEILKGVYKEVFRGSWDGLTYQKIADETKYSVEYLTKEVGYKLWLKLRNILDEPEIRKKNCHQTVPQALAKLSPRLSLEDRPFGDWGRIQTPNRFFGRQNLMRELWSEIHRGVSVSLVGESAIGKSSILSMISNDEWRRSASFGRPFFDSFLSIDMQFTFTRDEFFEALHQEFQIEPCTPFNLSRQLKKRGKRYVLSIDEIEQMLVDKEGFYQTRSFLRGLVQDEIITLIVASREPLLELFPDEPGNGKMSPFNICHTMSVPPFDKFETYDFLTQRLQEFGNDDITFSDAQIAQLYAETQGNPGYLQQAADKLYRSLMQISQ